MCGIVGVIDTVAGRVPPELIASLAGMMLPRGPDGGGHYFAGPVGLAMRRLSIIDLAGGWQPFTSRGGRVVAFQNGEIYNHQALRKQLEHQGSCFHSDSDTEVLAHGYAEWGPGGLVERLDGMFALAILDLNRRELHLARDRLGEKPLFYSGQGGRFAYASDLRVLASLPWVDTAVSAEALDSYLAVHYVPGDATIFEAVHRVLPGERLVVPIDAPQPQRTRYYRPPLAGGPAVSDDELADLIVQAVESRLLADVPVGVFLSGGLDSSIVAAVAARKQRHIATFSMGFRSAAHDESPYAAAVATAVGAHHHHFLFDDDDFRFLLPKVAAALDEPVGDQALLPLYWLCQEARRHVTVVLSGEGADEVFGGYSYYADPDRYAGLRRLVENPLPVTPSGFPLVIDAAARGRLLGRDRAGVPAWEEELITWLGQSADPLQRATAADLTTWLPDDLLVKFDRMSMAHSLEGRAPYLAPGVVAAGLGLPPAQRLNGPLSKVALRRVAARWLPADLLARPKQGFVLPMGMWLKQWFETYGPAHEYFLDRAVPGLDEAILAGLVQDDLLRGVQRERFLFALVLLAEWFAGFRVRRAEQVAIHQNYYRSLARPIPQADPDLGQANRSGPGTGGLSWPSPGKETPLRAS
jgi:asparagine synthase (glutamine-hydrolysing)